MSSSSPPSAAALVGHASFVRAVARSTLRGDDLVDDVVQDTYVTALERDGARRGPLGPWLGGIARRKALAAARRRVAVHKREARAARPEALSPALETAERAETMRRVVDAVLALPERYRVAIVLRYYDDLPPREIARRLQLPVETVRTHVRRGLGLLRVRLDEEAHRSGRDRRAFLLPLIEAPGSGAVLAASGSLGVLAVSKAVWIVGGLLVLGLIGVLVVQPWAPRSRGAPERASGPEATSPGAVLDAAPEAADATLVGRAPGAAPAASASPARDAGGRPVFPAIHRPASRIEGLVRDASRADVAGARVELRSTSLPIFQLARIGDDRGLSRSATSDGRGRFAFDDLPAGPYLLRAQLGAKGSAWHLVAARSAPDVVELTFREAGEGDPWALRVVDASREAVAGASVEVWAASDGRAALSGADEPIHWTGTSESDGRVPWPEWPAQYGLAVARTDDGRMGALTLDRQAGARTPGDETNREIVVREGGAVAGAVRTQGDGPVEGAWVEAYLRTGPQPYWTSLAKPWRVPVVDARYEFAALPAGTYDLVVGGQGWLRDLEWRSEGRYPVVDLVEVEPGGRAEVDLNVVPGGAVAGRVTSARGPLADAWVRVVRDPRTSNQPDGVHLEGVNVWRFDYPHGTLPDHPLTHRHARTDDDGRYRVGGLEPGTYRVEVGADSHSLVQRLDVEVARGDAVEVDAVLERAGVIQGTVSGASYFGARRVGEDSFRAVAILPSSGLFTFAGLPPGDYELAMPYWGWETAVLGTARVEVGRTTWVDLTNAGDHGITGRLLVGGAPLANAAVGLSWRGTTRSAEDGTFELRWLRAGKNAGSFHVRRAMAGAGDQTWQISHAALARAGVSDVGDLELGVHGLQVEVVDADGAGVPARLRLSVPRSARGMGGGSKGPGARLSLAAHIGSSGRVELEGLSADETYSLIVTLRSGLALQATASIPADKVVRFVAPATGRLEVVVRDDAGAPVEHAAVRVSTWSDPSKAPESGEAWRTDEDVLVLAMRTDVDGRAVVEDAPAGVVHVEAWVKAPLPEQARRSNRRLVLLVGETREVELRLPK